DTEYMSEDMQQAFLDLYNIANEKEIASTNRRSMQFIYHSQLAKEQNNIPMLLFGNGYMTHFYEMVFEMEVPAFLYNFGVIGFFIYFMPFLVIAIYGVYVLIKKVKNASVEFAMAVAGVGLAIAISFLSGYTFFNSSTMMIIIVLCTIVINNIKDLEDREVKIYKKTAGNILQQEKIVED
ncbi:MAG: O-antigen ligase family protein, partial [Clostridia bacterium]